MLEVLRDPIWVFVGGMIALAIPVCLFILQRNKKSLAYRILTETQLLTVDEQIKSSLQVVYKGIPVQNVHLVVLKVVNDGNVPVATSDFEQPLSFSFGSDTKILSAEITRVLPKTLKPKLIVDENTVAIEPTLLNSQDSLDIKLLLAQFGHKIEAEARIIGIREVRQVKDASRQFDMVLVLLAAVLVGVVFSLLGPFLLPVFGSSGLVILAALFFISVVLQGTEASTRLARKAARSRR